MMERVGQETKHKWVIWAMAASLITLSLAELARLYLGTDAFAWPARIAFLALCPCLIPFFTIREWALAILATVLAIALLVRVGGTADVLFALDRAAFFAAFIYLVTLLKEAAQRSASVLELGLFMTRQPPGRRYFSLALGGHVLGVVLNFGAISLLTPLIQRGVRASAQTAAAADISEQRQISALLRGFSWMIMWSPTALTQAVLFTSIPGVQASIVVPMGIAASVAMILLGRAVDLFSWRGLPVQENAAAPVYPARAATKFTLICLVLIAATFLVLTTADVSAAVALMLVAPITMIAWIYAQNVANNRAASIATTGTVLHKIFIEAVREPARSALVLGAAGFIGEAGAKLAPVAQVAEALNLDALPVWAFLIALPVIITLCGQIALSPILVVVFLAAVMNELPTLPADPNLIVFALGAGWALSMTASPNASATLLVSAVTNIPPTRLTWHWNGTYALASFILFSASFFVLALVFA